MSFDGWSDSRQGDKILGFVLNYLHRNSSTEAEARPVVVALQAIENGEGTTISIELEKVLKCLNVNNVLAL